MYDWQQQRVPSPFTRILRAAAGRCMDDRLPRYIVVGEETIQKGEKAAAAAYELGVCHMYLLQC